MENKRKYITGIDGLRSIAVMGVILYHLTPRFMPGGFLGVTLFFVISGYLMTDILLNEWHSRQKISLTNFYYKRARRIYPSLLIMFLLTGSTFLFISKDLLNNFREVFVTSLLNVNNFWQIMNGSSYFDRFGNESPFTHLWSLSIEGQFYLIWPIIVAFLLYKKEDHKRLTNFILSIAGLSAILMLAFYQPESLNRIYYGTDTRIFSILAGSYLAIFLRDYEEKIESIDIKWKLIGFFGSVLIIIMSFLLLKDSWSFVYRGGMQLFTVVSVILLGCVLTMEKANQLLTHPILKWIGTRSYEIYLWQFPVMITYERIVKWDGSYSYVHLFIQFILILGLSELTYRMVYFLRFKVKYQKEWFINQLSFWKMRSVVCILMLLIGTFAFAFIQAPSGKTQASVALEKKLNENKKKITEKETATTSSTTKDTESKTKETTEKSEETSSDSIPVKEDIIRLSSNESDYLKNIELTGIGDSLLLSAAPEIQAIFPKNTIDAEVGRQLMDSEPVFKKVKSDGKMGDVILVVLGTNGSFTTKEMENIMDYMSDKPVFFVNTMVQRPWQKAVNDELSKTAKNYKNVHIVDWKGYSEGNDDWFEEDDVHLTPEGAAIFSNFIGKEIFDVLNK